MKSQEEFDLSQSVLGSLTILGRQLSNSAGILFNKTFGVSIVDWAILAVLVKEPNISANQICRMIIFDKALISRRLKLLNRAGYVKTKLNLKNGTRTQSSLTAKGRKLYFRIVPIALERERKLLSGLTKEEISTLKKELFRMRENFPTLTDC